MGWVPPPKEIWTDDAAFAEWERCTRRAMRVQAAIVIVAAALGLALLVVVAIARFWR